MRNRTFFVVMVLVMCLVVPFAVEGGNWQSGGSSNGGLPVFEGMDDENLASGVSSSWWAEAREILRKLDYEISCPQKSHTGGVEGSYRALNRAHNLRTYFTLEGIRVIPRNPKDSEWSWGLRLRSWGVKGDLRELEKPSVSVLGNRIEYGREGFTEWYVNDSRGLEQGFTVWYAPQGIEGSSRRWLVLRMNVTGNLTGVLQPVGEGVEFRTGSGVGVLSFGHLRAEDATGRELVAKLELDGAVLDIMVDTTDAMYPLNIDPLATTPNWTAQSDKASGSFGSSVNTAGDVNGDGYSDVIVGARYYSNGQADEGRVFVYYGSAAGLSLTPNWTAESNQGEADFGSSASTAGDVNGDGYSDVIVGAYRYDNGQTNEGRAYVYYGSATGLSLTPNWTAESNQAETGFGFSVSRAGDVNGDGYSDVIVGSPAYNNGQAAEGRVFVYYGSAAGLSLTPNWTAESDQGGASMGHSVSTAGDVNGDGYSDVIVGAPWYDNGQTDEGRAYVYYGSATGLSLTPNWTAESDQAFSLFGNSVSTAGDVNGDGYSDVIVGTPSYDNGQTDEGRAYVYYGSATGLSLTPNWTAESDQAFSLFGNSVSTAGDVNGDGYSDVTIGASRYANGQYDEGRAYVYYGSVAGLTISANWSVESNQALASFGFSVGTAGDVNGDGFSDIIIGAPGYDNGRGRASVYYGVPENDYDGDRDGMPYGWELRYGLNPRLNDASGDKDDDGYTNLQEYKAGTDPTDPASKPRAAMPWLPLLLEDQ